MTHRRPVLADLPPVDSDPFQVGHRRDNTLPLQFTGVMLEELLRKINEIEYDAMRRFDALLAPARK